MTSASNRPIANVRTERMATGGEAVARLSDGRVIFVQGALADEAVNVQITEEKKRFARGVAIEIIDGSPHRVEPPCGHAASGQCGGCDWMYISADQQRSYKEAIVVEQLQRLGDVAEPNVRSSLFDRGRRTTVRCSVVGGQAGYRSRRSDESFSASECEAADPALESLIVEGDFGDAGEVTLRIGAGTGERMVVTDGDPTLVVVPDEVQVVAADDPGSTFIRYQVAGRRFRVSARSFFQTSTTGAEALVTAVQRGLAGSDGDVVDLYAGVGLLGAGAAYDRLRCAVESNPSSVADARHNLGSQVQVVGARVEQWSPRPFSTVIADPARRGLAKGGVAAVDGTGASHLVLVSCDPASLGRDAGLLAATGWQHQFAEVIDMFPDTSRIEVVSTFTR